MFLFIFLSLFYFWYLFLISVLHSPADPGFATIRIKLDLDSVSNKDADSVETHLAGQISQLLAILAIYLYPEKRIWQRFDDRANGAVVCIFSTVLFCHLNEFP